MKLAVIERMDYPEGKDSGNRFSMSRNYSDLLNELGVIVIPVITTYGIDEIAAFCDGFIISGNALNILPSYYGKEALEGLNYDIDTYPLDKAAIEAFARLHKPILGICGGLQSINVYYGGTLNQHIENHSLQEEQDHGAKVVEGTFIANVFGQESIRINSLHSQCIDAVAPGFKVSCVSDDGIIEAIEKDNIIGVQWHPEIMRDRQFFKTYIETFLK